MSLKPLAQRKVLQLSIWDLEIYFILQPGSNLAYVLSCTSCTSNILLKQLSRAKAICCDQICDLESQPNCLNFWPQFHVCSSSGYALYMQSVMPVCQRCHFHMSYVCHWTILKPRDDHGDQITTGALLTPLPLCDPIGKGSTTETNSIKATLFSAKGYITESLFVFFGVFLINVVSVSGLKRLLLDLVPQAEAAWIRAL